MIRPAAIAVGRGAAAIGRSTGAGQVGLTSGDTEPGGHRRVVEPRCQKVLHLFARRHTRGRYAPIPAFARYRPGPPTGRPAEIDAISILGWLSGRQVPPAPLSCAGYVRRPMSNLSGGPPLSQLFGPYDGVSAVQVALPRVTIAT